MGGKRGWESGLIVEHRYRAAIRAHVFSYLRDGESLPSVRLYTTLSLFFAKLRYRCHDTPARSLFSDKDVRVELIHDIGLNNSLLNEFVTFDVGIREYFSGGRVRSETATSHTFYFRSKPLRYLSRATYMSTGFDTAIAPRKRNVKRY